MWLFSSLLIGMRPQVNYFLIFQTSFFREKLREVSYDGGTVYLITELSQFSAGFPTQWIVLSAPETVAVDNRRAGRMGEGRVPHMAAPENGGMHSKCQFHG